VGEDFWSFREGQCGAGFVGVEHQPRVRYAGSRWKDTRMPMRYAERVLATRGEMAQAAKTQGKL
jgi:hypothetical protein